MEFSEYYVAYFDVLGYKEAFKKSEEVSIKLVESIEKSIELIKNFVSVVNSSSDCPEDDRMDVRYKVFSDNILICCKKMNDLYPAFSLVSFLRLVALIQRIFFENFHLIVRGGIAKGSFYFSDDFVGGKALIDAVDLEMNAKYPRIVVDENVLNDLKLRNQSEMFKRVIDVISSDLIIRLVDGVACLNYITVYDPWIVFPRDTIEPEKMESLEEVYKAYEEGKLLKPRYNTVYLPKIYAILGNHKQFIEKNVIRFSKSLTDSALEEKRNHILEKYLWLTSFHNKICEKLYKRPDLQISVKSTFNEQTLAFDVNVG